MCKQLKCFQALLTRLMCESAAVKSTQGGCGEREKIQTLLSLSGLTT